MTVASVNHRVRMLLDERVPMRDQVELSADVYLPDSAGTFPSVLIRTPYSNNLEPAIERARHLASSGYAAVIQDTRGRWDSDGAYYPFRHEGNDGYDTQQWVGTQLWSNGRIGTAGGSYLGIAQWTAAPQGSEHLACMTPRVAPAGNLHSVAYQGGALNLGLMMTWGMRINARTSQTIEFHDWTRALRKLPLIDAVEMEGRHFGHWKDWISHPSLDGYWREIGPNEPWEHVRAPAYNMGGWYDIFSKATFDNFNGLRRGGGSPEARSSKLICGPWIHALSGSTKTGDVDFGGRSVVDLDSEEQRWLDYWLMDVDNGIADEPPLRLFIMGANVWRGEHEWPLERTDWQKWHLHSGGGAATLRGDGGLSTDAPVDEAPDAYIYDPTNPVQTVGGCNCCSPEIIPWGPYDQRGVEMRPDVLCYTSDPLASDLEVTGPVKVVLYAESDAPDTDWTAKLVDVFPDGYAMNLCDGIIRARYREGPAETSLIEPGKVYEYEIDLAVTGNLFRAGHRVRLEISSSNFPRFDRNPNTGNDFGMDAELRIAQQTVHHSRPYPSHILLPVIRGD